MAAKDKKNANRSRNDPGQFGFVMKAVLGLTLFSAVCQIAITWLATLYVPVDQWPHFADLIETFKRGWESGLALFIGLFGGKRLR